MLYKEKYLEYINNLSDYKIGNFKLRLTEEKIAIALGISRSTLDLIRKGKVPTDKIKRKIAAGYDDFISQFITK